MNEENTFIEDVAALNLRNPVEAIIKKTNTDRATVNVYLKGKKQPGASFLVRFYQVYGEALVKAGRGKIYCVFVAPKGMEEQLKAVNEAMAEAIRQKKSGYELTGALSTETTQASFYQKEASRAHDDDE